MTNRDQIHAILSRPQERPLRASARRAAAGALIAVIALLAQFLSGYFESAPPAAYLAVGVAVSFLLWGSNRLWYSMIAAMFAEPFSLPAYVSRLPFWYLAGGIGFEAAVLALKLLGWATLYEIPARELFDTGAKVGVLAECILQAVEYPAVGRLLREARAGTHHT